MHWSRWPVALLGGELGGREPLRRRRAGVQVDVLPNGIDPGRGGSCPVERDPDDVLGRGGDAAAPASGQCRCCGCCADARQALPSRVRLRAWS
jgi:hypothetical protein